MNTGKGKVKPLLTPRSTIISKTGHWPYQVPRSCYHQLLLGKAESESQLLRFVRSSFPVAFGALCTSLTLKKTAIKHAVRSQNCFFFFKKKTHKIMILFMNLNILKPNDPKEGLITADNNFVCLSQRA